MTQHSPEIPFSLFRDSKLSRRGFLTTLSLAAAGSILAASAIGTKEAHASSRSELAGIDFITIANWGGTTSEAQVEAWGKAFTKRTGIKVRTALFDYGKFVEQIRMKRVEWNWADVEGFFPHQYPELLEPISPESVGISRRDMIEPSLLLPNAVPNFLWSYVIAYRKDTKAPHPTTWQEFFDVKAVPGRRSIYNWPYGMVEIALLADGVPFAQLYPLDLDRAFKKIKSLRDHLVFWKTGAESQQFLVSGSVDFIVAWDARINLLIHAGLPVAVEWNQNLRSNDYHILPKYDPKKAATIEFIKTALTPGAQAALALRGGLGPVTKAGFDALDDTLKSIMPSNPDNVGKAVGIINDRWWAKNLREVSTKWFEFVAG